MMGKEPGTSIAKAGDPKLRTNVSVGIVTSWLAPRSRWKSSATALDLALGCYVGHSGLLTLGCWVRVQAPLLERQCRQRRALWEEPQLWSQLGLGQN